MEDIRIRYVRSRRARRLSLRILPSGEVRVTYPWLCPKALATAFLENQRPWVEKHLAQSSQMEVWPLLDGDTPQTVLERARQFLPERIATLSAEAGLPFRGLTLRHMRSRYGSCSARGHITLNAGLVLVPRPLADSVILHELCHTVHMDHSAAFHQLLEEKTQEHFARHPDEPLVQALLAEAARSRAAYPLSHTLRKRLISRRLPEL